MLNAKFTLYGKKPADCWIFISKDIFGLLTLDPHTYKYMFSPKVSKHAEELG